MSTAYHGLVEVHDVSLHVSEGLPGHVGALEGEQLLGLQTQETTSETRLRDTEYRSHTSKYTCQQYIDST
jgi:hypothetical protein